MAAVNLPSRAAMTVSFHKLLEETAMLAALEHLPILAAATLKIIFGLKIAFGLDVGLRFRISLLRREYLKTHFYVGSKGVREEQRAAHYADLSPYTWYRQNVAF